MRQLLLFLASMITFSSLHALTIPIAATVPNLRQILVTQKLTCNNSQTQIAINECTKLSYHNINKRLNQVQQLLATL
ncbi:MAG: hypothetical protein V7K79_13455 [Nostoc sp.]